MKISVIYATETKTVEVLNTDFQFLYEVRMGMKYLRLQNQYVSVLGAKFTGLLPATCDISTAQKVTVMDGDILILEHGGVKDCQYRIVTQTAKELGVNVSSAPLVEVLTIEL